MTIPDDIMKTAREAASSIFTDRREPAAAAAILAGIFDLSAEVKVAVRATMAERERCAKVAARHSLCLRDCGDVIASAIRKGEVE